MRRLACALALALPLAAPLRAAAPLVSQLGTCAALTAGLTPADNLAWFQAPRQTQVVFYARLLFPLSPTAGEAGGCPAEAWHPPMPSSPAAGPGANDSHLADLEWLGPRGERVAFLALSLTPRAAADWVRVSGRDYVPQTVAMAIGLRDVRAAAGQQRLPSEEGQYTVRLRVDGRSLGLASFRVLGPGAGPAAAPVPAEAAPRGRTATAK